MSRACILALFGTLGLVACDGSSDGDTRGDGGSNDASNGLPDAFTDCSDPPCKVGLGAFSAHPGAIPYCPMEQAELELSCTDHPYLLAGACGELFAARYVYGFPGDYYECVYSGGVLVGAKWAPDNHPTQIAGTQLPESCTLPGYCSDGGADAGTD